jgi:hypothetical protein
MTGSNLFNRVIGLLQIRCDNSVEEIGTEVHFYEESAIALHIIMVPSLGNIFRSARKWKYVIRQGFCLLILPLGSMQRRQN